MHAIHTSYPQFAPNQILSSGHLNQLYDYLEEQGRLSRTHLIGIGIACGLEATVNEAGTGITISPGCGVTSAGHLVLWDEDEPLEFFAPYRMPEDIDYTFFDLPDGGAAAADTYPLWELTTDRNDNNEARAVHRDFLIGRNQAGGEGDEKVLLLLFECRALDNRNCTPSNCDDKGRTVETAVRPLLARRGDLEEIRRMLVAAHPGVEAYYSLSGYRAERLALPALRVPRFDVLNTRPATTRQLLEAYRRLLGKPFLGLLQEALDAVADALAPLLDGNPFADRVTSLDFLYDGSLLQGEAALAYSYYYDHLGTVVRAYEELRAAAEELYSLCCPDDRIFPRHLVLHHFTAEGISDALRHVWVSSPVQNRQAEGRRRLLSLVERLVVLLEEAKLPRAGEDFGIGPRGKMDIRITPSFLGRRLSLQAVPFYYDHPRLLPLWNEDLSRRGRPEQNLGYRAREWNPVDDYVRRPLAYGLEPYDFLRIEGAIGHPYARAVRDLRRQIAAFRLPIDVVALRTGDLTDELTVTDHSLHFSDLEAQYAAFRARLLGRLTRVLIRFYDTRMIPREGKPPAATLVAPSRVPLLARVPLYRYFRGTVGEFYEEHLDEHTTAAPYLVGFDVTYLFHLLIIHQIVRLVTVFPARLRYLAYPAAEQALGALLNGGTLIGRFVARNLNEAAGAPPNNPRLDSEEYSDQLDELVTGGELEELRQLYRSYEDRRKQVLRRQLFYHFQAEHPGLQAKAGTTLGGTYVLVYHGEEQAEPPREGRFRLAGLVEFDGKPVFRATVGVSGDPTAVTTTNGEGQFSLYVTSLPTTLRIYRKDLGETERWVQDDTAFLRIDLAEDRPDTADDRIPDLLPGVVIADFYLPYRCCGRGAPVHVFPPEAPAAPAEELTVGYEQVSCTRPGLRAVTGAPGAQRAYVALRVTGGTPPYHLTGPNGNRRDLPEEPIELAAGTVFRVRDSAGQEAELAVELLPLLRAELIGEPHCASDNRTFSHAFRVTGGRPPYRYTYPAGQDNTLDAGVTAELTGIPSGKELTLPITDAFGEQCSVTLTVPAHPCDTNSPACDLPCGGIALRAAYPLWAQAPATETIRYSKFTLTVRGLRLTLDNGTAFGFGQRELTRLNRSITGLSGNDGPLDGDSYPEFMSRVAKLIQENIQQIINGPAGLPRQEPALHIAISTADGPDRLVVTTFECFRFEFVAQVRYLEVDEASEAEAERDRVFTYSTDGVVTDDNHTFPSFDRMRLDRCAEDAQPRRLCEETLKVTIEIEDGDNTNRLTAKSDNSNADLRYWWDTQLAATAGGTGSPLVATYRTDGISVPVAVLAVDPATGCFATDIASVNR